jgi:hypothetical protein
MISIKCLYRAAKSWVLQGFVDGSTDVHGFRKRWDGYKHGINAEQERMHTFVVTPVRPYHHGRRCNRNLLECMSPVWVECRTNRIAHGSRKAVWSLWKRRGLHFKNEAWSGRANESTYVAVGAFQNEKLLEKER